MIWAVVVVMEEVLGAIFWGRYFGILLLGGHMDWWIGR